MNTKIEVFNADKQRNTEINNLLQRIKYKADKQEAGTFVYFPIILLKGSKVEYPESTANQILFREFKKWGAIEIIERSVEEMNETLKELAELKNQPLIVEGYFVKPIEPKFSQLCSKFEKSLGNTGDSTFTKNKMRVPAIELLFPESVQWEKVMLKIKEGRQDIEIFYNNKHIRTADYIQLGFFVGTKQQKPDRQWGFLCALSVFSATDIRLATADKMRGMIAVDSNDILEPANVHQIKRTLVKRFQGLFKTEDDPFSEQSDYYDPKFTILPEPALRQKEIWFQGGQLNENRAYDDNNEEAL